jgi:hypothetical protein
MCNKVNRNRQANPCGAGRDGEGCRTTPRVPVRRHARCARHTGLSAIRQQISPRPLFSPPSPPHGHHGTSPLRRSRLLSFLQNPTPPRQTRPLKKHPTPPPGSPPPPPTHEFLLLRCDHHSTASSPSLAQQKVKEGRGREGGRERKRKRKRKEELPELVFARVGHGHGGGGGGIWRGGWCGAACRRRSRRRTPSWGSPAWPSSSTRSGCSARGTGRSPNSTNASPSPGQQPLAPPASISRSQSPFLLASAVLLPLSLSPSRARYEESKLLMTSYVRSFLGPPPSLRCSCRSVVRRLEKCV